MISALQSLLIVTVINFFVVTTVTIGVLYLIDKVKEHRESTKE